MALAVAVCACVQGYHFPSSDCTAFVPWLYRLSEPALYSTDLRFSTWPSAYFMPYTYLMYFLGQAFSIPWAFILFNAVSQALLLAGLHRLARDLTGTRAPYTLLAFLSLGRIHLGGGYYLSSPHAAPHYLSMALVLLGHSALFRRRWVNAIPLLMGAVLVNQRIGGLGLCIAALAWYLRNGIRARLNVKGLSIAACAAIVACLALAVMTRGTQDFSKIKFFFRAPAHYQLSSWGWSPITNLVMCAAFLAVWFRYSSLPRIRLVCLTALALCAVLAVGMMASEIFYSPVLVVLSLGQLGPFVLAYTLVLMGAWIARSVAEGHIFTATMIAFGTNMQSRLAMTMISLAGECCRGDKGGDGVFRGWEIAMRRKLAAASPASCSTHTGYENVGTNRSKLCHETLTGAGQVLALLAFMAMGSSPWLDICYSWSLVGYTVLLATIATATICILRRISSAPIGAQTVAWSVILVAALWASGRIDGIRIDYGVDPDWVAACESAQGKTSADACFVVSPDAMDFEYRSRRSTFGHWNSGPLNLAGQVEWFRRMQLLKVTAADLTPDGLSRAVTHDFNGYSTMTEEDFRQIKHLYPQVTHVVVRAEKPLEFPLVYRNSSFSIFSISDESVSEVEPAGEE
jgi:hypothetical protein